MRRTENVNKKVLVLFGMLILIPFILHIYSLTFPLLYWNKIEIPSITLVILGVVLGLSKKMDSQIVCCIPFLVAMLIDVIFFQPAAVGQFLKYLCYFLIYFLLLRPHYSYTYVYKIYINFNVIWFIVMFAIYISLQFFELDQSYSANNLFLPETSAAVTRVDFDYFLPFYILSITEPSAGIGVLGVPRFSGFSAEPTLYACVILPAIFLSLKIGMRIQFFVLVFALLVTSSFYSLLVFICGFILIAFFRYRLAILCLLLILIFGYLGTNLAANISINLLGADRFLIYKTMVELTLSNMDQFVPFSSGIVDYEASFSGIIHFLLMFGYIPFVGYLIFLCGTLRGIMYTKDKYLFAFIFVSLFMLIKSGEILSPLLLFLLNYANCEENSN